MRLVRFRRTGLIVPRGGLRTTRTVAYLTGLRPGARRLRMGRVSIIVNEWAHHRTPKSCRVLCRSLIQPVPA